MDNSLFWVGLVVSLIAAIYTVRAIRGYRRVAEDAESDYAFRQREGLLGGWESHSAYVQDYRRYHAPRGLAYVAGAMIVILLLTYPVFTFINFALEQLWIATGRSDVVYPGYLVWQFMIFFSVIGFWGLIIYLTARRYHRRAPVTFRNALIPEYEAHQAYMKARRKLIRALPKAELHLHIEGSLEPEQMFVMAERNGVELPFETVDEIRQAYNFNNLQEFLDIYYQGMSVLLTKQDFFDLTYAYLERVSKDNCRHVEIFFDPQGHTERGVPFSVAIEGILDALKQGEADFGISSHLILSFLRHLSEDAAFETLEQAKPYLPHILGVGLDSSELGHPPSKFKNVFAKAKDLGLKIFAHAGEEGPPDYIYEALDLLKVDRIDHGNRALEDDALVERLVREKMFLTVCPLSNLKLCVIDNLRAHPLKKMLDMGMKVTVNSDDPSYFGGYLNDNYIQTANAIHLTNEDIIQLAKNSFEGAYLTDAQKLKYMAEIDALAMELR